MSSSGPCRPIRVSLCITELEPGGAEKNLVELATRADRRRFSIDVVSLKPAPPPDRSKLLTRLVAAGICPVFLGAKGPLTGLLALTRLRRIFVHTKPLIVQSFLFHANLLSRIAARLSGVPAVIAGVRVAEKAKRWHLWAERLTQRWVDRYVCVSTGVAQHLVRHCRVPQQKTVVIPNGVDLRAIDEKPPVQWSQYGLPASADVILYVGRLDFQKGVDLLLKLAPQLIEAAPQTNPHVVIVGDGPDRSKVEAAVRMPDFQGRLHYLGWLTDPIPLMRAARVIVLPSRWEGMPNVILEAMACKRPVVAMNVEGVAELLGEGAELQTAPPRCESDWVARVRALLTNPNLCARLGQLNRARAEGLFNIDRMVGAYEELWERLVSQATR